MTERAAQGPPTGIDAFLAWLFPGYLNPELSRPPCIVFEHSCNPCVTHDHMGREPELELER